VTSSLEEFVAAGPLPQRAALRVVLSLARRRRGRKLLRAFPQADQLAHALLAMARYDDPLASRPLGWDPVAVSARGADIRRAEGRL
jgi:hypothetical protein